MSMIIQEGSPPLPVVYGTWLEWRDTQRHALRPPPLMPDRAEFCALCWGQGRIHEAAGNGEGLIPTPCPGCEGAGVVARRAPG